MASRSGGRRVDPGSPLVDLDVVFADDAAIDRICNADDSAGRVGHRRAVGVLLDDLGLADQARANMADLAPDSRIRLLTELAVLRDDVQAIVLTSPDRHGGDPLGWWKTTGDLAVRGYAVLVIAGDASAHAINALDRSGAEL
jgi:hypothetical protein